jgi:alpha-D-ribose 1-methylphosphonate 5-phosphate C-P lyase
MLARSGGGLQVPVLGREVGLTLGHGLVAVVVVIALIGWNDRAAVKMRRGSVAVSATDFFDSFPKSSPAISNPPRGSTA